MTDYPWPDTAQFANIGPGRVHYAAEGDGEALLLLHAGIADLRMWDAQIPAFRRRYRTIRYDLRGFGRSPLPDAPFANHEDALGLLDRLGVRRAHVVGISFGGLVALDFSLAHPERVRSLVLVAPSVSGEPPGEALRLFWEAEEAALERGDLDEAVEVNLRTWVDGPQRSPDQVDPEVRRKVGAMQRLAFEIEEPAGAESIDLDPPAAQRLGELRPPLLVLVGNLDTPEKLSLARRMEHEVPGARLETLPDCAHVPNMERPEAFNRSVLDFLNAVDASE